MIFQTITMAGAVAILMFCMYALGRLHIVLKRKVWRVDLVASVAVLVLVVFVMLIIIFNPPK